MYCSLLFFISVKHILLHIFVYTYREIYSSLRILRNAPYNKEHEACGTFVKQEK